jgi:hypothetical protein
MGGLSGFSERKSHVLTAGTGAGANYQMRIHIIYGAGADSGEDMYCDSKCNADFSDLRFTSSDEQTLLSYWLESKLDGDNAIFWVKVTEDLDSDRTIYVYYGNSYAASLSSQANTFVDVISGVVGAWNMEEATNTDPVIDYSGNGNNGTPSGTTIVAGEFTGKTVRRFNGAGNWIDLDSPATFNILTPISFSTSIKLNDSYSAQGVILGKRDGANIAYGMYINAGHNTIGVWMWNGVGIADVTQVFTFSLNEWYDVGFTFDDTANSLIIYINGVAYSKSTTNVFRQFSTVHLSLGAYYGNEGFKGDIASCILYNQVISGTNYINLNSNYPDVSLDAGKVLVRKYATTTLPTHGDWGTELDLPCYCSRHARRRRLKRGR